MPKILFPSQAAFPFRQCRIVYDDPEQQDLLIDDYDGVWASSDPRILEFCGIGKPRPTALIYVGPPPPEGLFGLASEFVTEYKQKYFRLGREFNRVALREEQQERLRQEFGDYVEAANSVLQRHITCLRLPPSRWSFDIISGTEVQTKPYKGEDIPHIDNPSRYGNYEWGLFLTLAGDKSTIFTTAHRCVVQALPGEILAWRQGIGGSYHAAPEGPYTRLTWARSLWPTGKVPESSLVWDVPDAQRPDGMKIMRKRIVAAPGE